MRMVKEGKSPEQMRRAIDEKYGSLGGGTDTPAPQ